MDRTASLTPTTRLAPSPTGALHLGNARTFLINWALAKQNGWNVVLRLEDLEGPRVKPEACQEAEHILQWLGLDWDQGPWTQLADLTPYHQALQTLHAKGLIYPCTLTRSQIARAQSAPHLHEHEQRCPSPKVGPQVTDPSSFLREDEHAWRIRIPDEPTTFTDDFAGLQACNVQQEVGDFVVATKAGLPAYQLAVVVDDHRQGITHVVRGDDLISSAARQRWLYQFLDYEPLPRYFHLPLVLGHDGRRLAKRHGDTKLITYQQQGVPPQRIVGLIARWSGLSPRLEPMSAKQFAQQFDLTKLPHDPVTFTLEDHTWLITP